MTDEVNNPPHYNKGGMECIDYIRQQLGDNFRYYCEGNVHKYLHRFDYKNSMVDLKIQDLKVTTKTLMSWRPEEAEAKKAQVQKMSKLNNQ